MTTRRLSCAFGIPDDQTAIAPGIDGLPQQEGSDHGVQGPAPAQAWQSWIGSVVKVDLTRQGAQQRARASESSQLKAKQAAGQLDAAELSQSGLPNAYLRRNRGGHDGAHRARGAQPARLQSGAALQSQRSGGGQPAHAHTPAAIRHRLVNDLPAGRFELNRTSGRESCQRHRHQAAHQICRIGIDQPLDVDSLVDVYNKFVTDEERQLFGFLDQLIQLGCGRHLNRIKGDDALSGGRLNQHNAAVWVAEVAWENRAINDLRAGFIEVEVKTHDVFIGAGLLRAGGKDRVLVGSIIEDSDIVDGQREIALPGQPDGRASQQVRHGIFPDFVRDLVVRGAVATEDGAKTELERIDLHLQLRRLLHGNGLSPAQQQVAVQADDLFKSHSRLLQLLHGVLDHP